MVEVYGIGGGNGVGKTELATRLHETADSYEHIEFSGVVAEVANRWLKTAPNTVAADISEESEIASALNRWIDDLPAAIYGVLGVDAEPDQFRIDPNESEYNTMHYKLVDYAKTTFTDGQEVYITAENEKQHADLLKWLGYSVRECVDSYAWSEEVRRRIGQICNNNSPEIITACGVRFIEDVEAIKNAIPEARSRTIELRRSSAAEKHTYSTETSLRGTDVVINNDGSLEQLRRVAPRLRDSDYRYIKLRQRRRSHASDSTGYTQEANS